MEHKVKTSSQRSKWLSAADGELLGECDVHTYRASGPGGQKRNKTDSAVRLRHRPTEITVVGTESRSQHENRARALRRLRLAIALTIREHIDVDPNTPVALPGDYVGPDGHLRINRKNPDYVHWVARILDTLHACHGRLSATADAIGTTTAQLTRLLVAEKKLLAAANQLRAVHGQRALRP